MGGDSRGVAQIAPTLLLFFSGLLASGRLPSAQVSANVGDESPGFGLSDSAGRVYRLSDYRGKNAVVLEFFRGGDW